VRQRILPPLNHTSARSRAGSWRTIQQVLDAGYRDAFRHLQPDLVGLTFPTWGPHVRLDYLFVPERFLDRVARCQVVTEGKVREASDHYPLVSELT